MEFPPAQPPPHSAMRHSISSTATRRGVETVNSREGANQAVLVGEFLLARAGIEAARVSKEVAFSLAANF